MADSPPLPAAPDAVTLLEAEAVLFAISDPARYSLLRALADTGPQSVNTLAAKLARPADGISKHLRVLRDARLVRAVTPPDTDGRKQYHEIPALFRSRDAAGKVLLDFGSIVLRFD
jgi:DNA-binding transcriptional ArsR family regulator